MICLGTYVYLQVRQSGLLKIASAEQDFSRLRGKNFRICLRLLDQKNYQCHGTSCTVLFGALVYIYIILHLCAHLKHKGQGPCFCPNLFPIRGAGGVGPSIIGLFHLLSSM